jgi:pimeloyl-ACP methyl ester carboxylesterase
MSANALIPYTSIRRVEADGLSVFYREAGPPNGPVVLLLHGFPTSSFQYRELITTGSVERMNLKEGDNVLP